MRRACQKFFETFQHHLFAQSGSHGYSRRGRSLSHLAHCPGGYEWEAAVAEGAEAAVAEGAEAAFAEGAEAAVAQGAEAAVATAGDACVMSVATAVAVATAVTVATAVAGMRGNHVLLKG